MVVVDPRFSIQIMARCNAQSTDIDSTRHQVGPTKTSGAPPWTLEHRGTDEYDSGKEMPMRKAHQKSMFL
jgi:hypothetical protein